MLYKNIVKELTPKENIISNAIVSFLSGGIIGVIAEIMTNCFSTEIMLVIFIVVAAVLTGMGLFDTLVKKCRMGVVIPITGFANTVASASLDYKHEGLITGIGSNYFKLCGSVILYGIISATFFALLRGLLCLV